jgi:outer membrane immunogenic protein
MKKLTLVLAASTALISAPALAADLRMPVKAPAAYAPAPYFSWTGCYIGAHGGGGFGDKRLRDPATDIRIFSFDVDGGLAGGQVGCDWQTGAFVLGVEGSASWANITGNGADLPTGVLIRAHSDADFIGTATARIGWAFGQSLLYVKGGGAWVHEDYRLTVIPAPFTGTEIARGDTTHTGWTVGAGFEYAFTPNWSLKVEYNYIDVSRDRVDFTFTPAFGGGACCSADIDQRIHVVKAGVNWRFNFGGPVVAAY